MADTESILQLGIEAARAGDKAEARELFRLVTRAEPHHVQGWLWLAGVAQDREEKRAALERVVAIDPANELARKGLAVLKRSDTPAAGARPAAKATAAAAAASSAGDDPTLPLSTGSGGAAQPPAPQSGARQYGPPPPPAAPAPGTASGQDTWTAPTFDAEEHDLQNYGEPAYSGVVPAPASPGAVIVDDEEARPRRRLGWLPLVLVLAAVLIAALFLWRSMGNRSADTAGASSLTQLTAAPGDQDTAALGATLPLSGTEVPVAAAATTPTPEQITPPPEQTPPAEQTPAPPAEQTAGEANPPALAVAPPPETATPAPPDPTEAPAPPAPTAGIATANPAIVPNDTLVPAGSWSFTFTGDKNVTGSSFGGAAPAHGQYQIVLVAVINGGDRPATIPDGFFVLKDAEGRLYDFNRAASVDYLNRFGAGVAGDVAADTPVLNNNRLTSVPLLFDVPPDATNLVLFSRDNVNQGFLIR